MKKVFLISCLLLGVTLLFGAAQLRASGVLPGMCREPANCYSCHHIQMASKSQNCSACHSGYYKYDYGPGCCESGVYGTIGNMVIGRWNQELTVLKDNRVLITGGYSNYVGLMSGLAETFEDTVEIFDPATGESRLLESKMSSPRIGFTSTLLKDGKVLVVGGATSKIADEGELLKTAEIFDPETEEFTPTGSMYFARSRHTATLLDDGRVLITGGGNNVVYRSSYGQWTAELYDPVSGTFSLAWFMNAPRQNHSAVLLDDGRVFISGGCIGTATSNVLASTEFFDPETNLFTKGPDMATGRLGIGVTKLRDGRVLMGPGVDYEMSRVFQAVLPLNISNDSEIFDPATDTFTPSDPQVPASAYMHEIGDYQSYCLLDGTVLRADGGDEVWEYPVSHLFDPTTKTYSYAGSVKYPRWETHAVMLKDGRPLEIGGYHMLYGFINQIEVYTPSLESQVAGLKNVVSDLAMNEILAQLDSISTLIADEDYSSALASLNGEVLPAMDGCFGGDQSDDRITDCDDQSMVYHVAQLLATTLEKTITGNQAPEAYADADVLSGEKPLEVQFEGSGFDEDGDVVVYTWDFGDYHLGSGENPTNVYEHAGTYKVTLTAVDDYGAEAEDTLTIVVTENGDTFKVSYATHVQPVLDAFCHNCHPGGFVHDRQLLNYEQVMEPNDKGVIVVPYEPDSSKLVQYLEAGHPFMNSPHGYGSKFIEDIRDWIAEGALNN